MNLEEINREVIAIMKRHYGDRLAKIVLFGSYARGDFRPDSDMDILVAVNDPAVSIVDEIARLTPDFYDLFLEKSVWVSAKPVSLRDFNESQRSFFNEVRREGKTIYEQPAARIPV